MGSCLRLAVHILCVCSYIAGIGYLVAIPYRPLVSQGLYVDEHALMPGSANADFEPNQVRVLLKQMQQFHRDRAEGGHALAAASFEHAGIRPHTFKFCSLDTPLTASLCRMNVSLVYGFVRAPRGDGKETTLIVTDSPYAPVSSADAASDDSVLSAGLSGALAVLKLLRHSTWLSKDLLLVAVAGPSAALRRSAFRVWLDVYHHSRSHRTGLPTSTGHMLRRSGRLAGGLCLEVRVDRGKVAPSAPVTILVSGHGGKLPNLDVVSGAVQVMTKSGLPHSFAETFAAESPLGPKFNPLLQRHIVTLRAATNLALSKQTGYHGHLLDYNVDSLTLRLSLSVGETSKELFGILVSERVTRFMMVADGIVHSWNNLVEKLHHSTFMYVVTGDHNFATMNKYFPAVVLLMLPLPLQALRVLFVDSLAGVVHSVFVLFAVWLGSCGASYATPALEALLNLDRAQLVQRTVLSLSLSFAFALCLLHVTPKRTVRVVSPVYTTDLPLHDEGDKLWFDWKTVRTLLFLFLPCLLMPLAILNFSLAAITCLALVPMVTCVQPRAHTAAKALQLVCLVTLSPCSLLAVMQWSGPASSLYVFMVELFASDNEDGGQLSVVMFYIYFPCCVVATLLAWPWRSSANTTTHQKTE